MSSFRSALFLSIPRSGVVTDAIQVPSVNMSSAGIVRRAGPIVVVPSLTFDKGVGSIWIYVLVLLLIMGLIMAGLQAHHVCTAFAGNVLQTITRFYEATIVRI